MTLFMVAIFNNIRKHRYVYGVYSIFVYLCGFDVKCLFIFTLCYCILVSENDDFASSIKVN